MNTLNNNTTTTGRTIMNHTLNRKETYSAFLVEPAWTDVDKLVATNTEFFPEEHDATFRVLFDLKYSRLPNLFIKRGYVRGNTVVVELAIHKVTNPVIGELRFINCPGYDFTEVEVRLWGIKNAEHISDEFCKRLNQNRERVKKGVYLLLHAYKFHMKYVVLDSNGDETDKAAWNHFQHHMVERTIYNEWLAEYSKETT